MPRLWLTVVSGKGGVGKTTVSVNLAVTLSYMGYRVGLMDADVYGPNAHLLLGMPDVPPAEDSGSGMLKPAMITKYNMEFMSVAMVLPEGTGLALKADYVLDIIRTMVEFTEWKSDIVVVDAPPGSQDVVNYLLGLVSGKARAVMVVEPHPFALSDCKRLLDILDHLGVPLKAIVVNKTNLYPEAEKVMRELQVEAQRRNAILHTLPWDERLARGMLNTELFIELARGVLQ